MSGQVRNIFGYTSNQLESGGTINGNLTITGNCNVIGIAANPFDQTLNTTDNIQFNQITTTSEAGITCSNLGNVNILLQKETVSDNATILYETTDGGAIYALGTPGDGSNNFELLKIGGVNSGTSFTILDNGNQLQLGTSANGYTLPRTRGTTGQLLVEDGTGVPIWSNDLNLKTLKIVDDSGVKKWMFDSVTGNLLITNNAGAIIGKITQTGEIGIGVDAGKTGQLTHCIALGTSAGMTNQQSEAIAIGRLSGASNQGARNVAIGYSAGRTDQLADSIAIGVACGNNNQGISAIAIGYQAGESNQSSYGIALGHFAGFTTQGHSCVAMSIFAGQKRQKHASIAIGSSAGRYDLGLYSIAIGRLAEEGLDGTPNNDKTIVLNASGSVLNSAQASSFYVNPIRAATASQILHYNTTTKEVSYAAATTVLQEVLTSTVGLNFPSANLETIIITTGSPVIGLLAGDQITVNMSGALLVPAAGPWVLTIRIKMCNISIPFDIALPATLVTSNQFRANIKTTIRVNGASGTTYSTAKFEYMSDAGALITTIQELGFIAIDTTSTTNNLHVSAQFDGSPNGLALFTRGADLRLFPN